MRTGFKEMLKTEENNNPGLHLGIVLFVIIVLLSGIPFVFRWFQRDVIISEHALYLLVFQMGFYAILCLGTGVLLKIQNRRLSILPLGIAISLIPAVLSVLMVTVFYPHFSDYGFIWGCYLSIVSYLTFFLAFAFEFRHSFRKEGSEKTLLKDSLNTLQDTVNLLEMSNDQLSVAVVQANQRVRAAREANEYKTLFLAKMSHEIRTPLNTIVGFSQLLANQLSKIGLPNNCIEYLKSIQVGSRLLSAMINNILDLAKIEAGKETVSLENVDIQTLFQNEYHLHKAAADEAGIHLSYDWDQALPRNIRTDVSKVHQVLSNIIVNAIKNTPEGGGISMRALAVDNCISIVIQDSGKGIPNDKLGKLFTPFEQIRDSYGKAGPGTGLGLVIAKQLIELLGGKIDVRSEEGKGTAFTITFPIQTMDEFVEEAKVTDAFEAQFDPSNVVLIVEDDLENLQMLNELLKSLGIQHVHGISNGEQILLTILDVCPDVVILDLNLQNIDGLAAVMAVRCIKDPQIANTQIVVITGDAFNERHDRASKLGIVDYLLKPVDVHDLVSVLSKYLKMSEKPKVALSVSGAPRLPIPDQVRREVAKCMQELKQVPMHHGARVLEMLDVLRKKCAPYHHPFSHVFDGIEQAVYSANDQNYALLLEEGCRLGNE